MFIVHFCHSYNNSYVIQAKVLLKYIIIYQIFNINYNLKVNNVAYLGITDKLNKKYISNSSLNIFIIK